MKKTLITTVLAALALSALPGLGQPINSTADMTAPAPQLAPNPQAFATSLQQMQTHLQQMQEQMDTIRQTQDPQERHELLEEHWTTIQQAMTELHEWVQAGEYGMSWHLLARPMLGGDDPRLTPEQRQQRQDMAEQYMNMQQMLMDQIRQHMSYQ